MSKCSFFISTLNKKIIDTLQKLDKAFDKVPLILSCIFIVILFSLSSIIAIFSTVANDSLKLNLLCRQLESTFVGVICIIVLSRIPFVKILKNWFYFLVGYILLIWPVLIFGVRINGMKGWYRIGDVTIQPSEIARSLFLVALCYLFSQNINSIKRFFLLVVFALITIGPIIVQPDLGTAIVFSLVLYIIYFLMEKNFIYLLVCPLVGVTGVVLFCMKHKYALKRITGFLDPEADLHRSGWHIMQFKFAIARGHLTGVKSNQAAWSKSYLPFSYNDSIFASAAEITGFVGVICLIVLIMLLAYLLIKKQSTITNMAARLFLIGSACFILVQSFLHSSVNVAILPPTGITFPFFSFGGSSFIGFSILLGFALSASKCTIIETK